MKRTEYTIEDWMEDTFARGGTIADKIITINRPVVIKGNGKIENCTIIASEQLRGIMLTFVHGTGNGSFTDNDVKSNGHATCIKQIP